MMRLMLRQVATRSRRRPMMALQSPLLSFSGGSNGITTKTFLPTTTEDCQRKKKHVRTFATSRQKRSGNPMGGVNPPPPRRADESHENSAHTKAETTEPQEQSSSSEAAAAAAPPPQQQQHSTPQIGQIWTPPEPKILIPPTSDLSTFIATPSLLQDTPYTTLDTLQRGAQADENATGTTLASGGDTTMSDLGALRDLYDPKIHLSATAPSDWSDYEAATPLWEELAAWIGVAGRPISVADYMRLCLTHPAYGYYTQASRSSGGGSGSSSNSVTTATANVANADDDFDANEWDDGLGTPTSKTPNEGADNLIIGPGGDFVTAPEMIQIFGECLGVWFMSVWQLSIPKPVAWQWLEGGPGKGSLMVDLIRFAFTVEKIRNSFGSGCRGIHFIEHSPKLRQVQKQALTSDVGHLVHFEFPQDAARNMETNKISDTADNGEANMKPSIPVYWHDTIAAFHLWQKENNSYLATFAICQEFLDALPVYAFEKTEEGWRERLVDIAMREDFELEENGDTKRNTASNVGESVVLKGKKKPRLRLVTAPEVTPAAKTLLQVNEETGLMPNENPPAPLGSIVEVNPEGILLTQELARIIDKQGGGALVIDYGQEGSHDSIRAFARHQQVHFLSRPGQVDVTADVDFAALRHAVNALQLPQNTQAFGPVRQGDFLMSMGAQDRAIHLIESENTSAEEAENIYEALVRLCDPKEMGERFKVLAIARKKDGIFQPPGF